jgi:hypothetical protein
MDFFDELDDTYNKLHPELINKPYKETGLTAEPSAEELKVGEPESVSEKGKLAAELAEYLSATTSKAQPVQGDGKIYPRDVLSAVYNAPRSMGEVALGAGAGAISWAADAAARIGYGVGTAINQKISPEQYKKPEYAGMTEDEIIASNMEKAGQFTELALQPVTQTIAPKTVFAQRALRGLGQVLEPINVLSTATKKKAEEVTGSPIAGAITKFATEYGVFKGAHSGAKAVKNTLYKVKAIEKPVSYQLTPEEIDLKLQEAVANKIITPEEALKARQPLQEAGVTVTATQGFVIKEPSPTLAKVYKKLGLDTTPEVLRNLGYRDTKVQKTRSVKEKLDIDKEATAAREAEIARVQGEADRMTAAGKEQGGYGRKELPPGQGFELVNTETVTQPGHPRAGEMRAAVDEVTGEARRLPALPESTGLQGLPKEGEGFVVSEPPVKTIKTPMYTAGEEQKANVPVTYAISLSKNGAPFTTSKHAGAAAVKRGLPIGTFNIVPVGTGFGFQRKPREIAGVEQKQGVAPVVEKPSMVKKTPVVKKTPSLPIPEKSKIDVVAGTKSAPQKAAAPIKTENVLTKTPEIIKTTEPVKSYSKATEVFSIQDIKSPEYYKEQAKEIGVEFDGMQSIGKGKPAIASFTDPVTGSQFMSEEGKTIVEALNGIRKNWGAEEYKFPEVVKPKNTLAKAPTVKPVKSKEVKAKNVLAVKAEAEKVASETHDFKTVRKVEISKEQQAVITSAAKKDLKGEREKFTKQEMNAVFNFGEAFELEKKRLDKEKKSEPSSEPLIQKQEVKPSRKFNSADPKVIEYVKKNYHKSFDKLSDFQKKDVAEHFRFLEQLKEVKKSSYEKLEDSLGAIEERLDKANAADVPDDQLIKKLEKKRDEIQKAVDEFPLISKSTASLPEGKQLDAPQQIEATGNWVNVKKEKYQGLLGKVPERTVIAELLQNSFDAVVDNDGKIEVNIYPDRLEVTDTGKGMNRETVKTHLVSLAEQGSKGAEDLGGMGNAKVVIMGWGDSFKVITVGAEEGVGKVKSTVWGTKEDYMIHSKVNFESSLVPDDTPTGTTVVINHAGMNQNDVVNAVRMYGKNLRIDTPITVNNFDATGYKDVRTISGEVLKDTPSKYPVDTVSLPGGSVATIKFTPHEPYGWGKGNQRITTKVYNKGLPLNDLAEYSFLNALYFRKKPDFVVEINFDKTPSAEDYKNYPFVLNRTRFKPEVEEVLKALVKEKLDTLSAVVGAAEKDSLMRMFSDAPAYGKNKIPLIIPYEDAGIKKAIAAELNKHKPVLNAFGNIATEFFDLIEKTIGSEFPDHAIAYTTEQSVHGFRPKSGLLDHDYVVVNPFSFVRFLENDFSSGRIEVTDKSARKAATAFVNTLVHEAIHFWEPDHYEEFTKQFHKFTEDVGGHENLVKLERRAYGVFKKYGDDLANAEEAVGKLQEGGKIAEIFSDSVSGRGLDTGSAVQGVRGDDVGRIKGAGKEGSESVAYLDASFIPVKDLPPQVREVMKTLKAQPGAGGGLYRNKELWEKTGFWLGKDGKWRYELDDVWIRSGRDKNLAVTGNPDNMEYRQYIDLDELYDENAKMFEAVPELRKVRIRVNNDMEGTLGKYSPDKKTIDVQNKSMLSLSSGVEETIRHELQHAINDIVGSKFKGGNPDIEELKIFNSLINELRASTKNPEILKDIDALVEGKFNPTDAYINTMAQKADTPVERQQILKARSIYGKEVALENYLKLPGEMEARLAEKRMSMSKKEWKTEPPWETLDKMLEKEEGEKTTSGTTLYSNPVFSPELWKKNINDAKKLYTSAVELGKILYESGKTKYFEWQKEVKKYVGEAWSKVKSFIAKVWKNLTRVRKEGGLGSDKGSFSLKKTIKQARETITTETPKTNKQGEPIVKQRVVHVSEKTALKKAVSDYTRFLDAAKQELNDLAGPEGKVKFEQLKNERILEFQRKIAKVKTDPTFYRKQGYQQAIENFKKKEFSEHVRKLKARVDSLEKSLSKLDQKAVTTKDVRDILSPEVTLKDFKRLKALPDMKGGDAIKRFFENPIYSIESWGNQFGPKATEWALETFYYPFRRANDISNREFQKFWGKAEEFKKSLPSEASERIGAYAISKEYGGKEKLAQMGVEIPKLSPEEMKAYETMRKDLEGIYPVLNEARVRSGLPSFGHTENYFTFSIALPEAERLGFGVDDTRLAHYVHPKATGFEYAEKRVKHERPLVLDSFSIYQKYMKSALRHIHFSPEIARMRELLGSIKVEGEKTWSMEKSKPIAYKLLTSYIDFVSGKTPDSIISQYIPKPILDVMIKLSTNIAISNLSGNLKSAMIQPTALINTFAEIGSKYTAKGVAALFDEAAVAQAMKESHVLVLREMDLDIADITPGFVGTLARARQKVNSSWAGLKLLKSLDMQTAIATYIGAKAKAIEFYKMSEEAARKYADNEVVFTQASTALHDLPPVQRLAIGRFFMTFQSFVINNWNFLQNKIFTKVNPKMAEGGAEGMAKARKAQAAKIARWVLGTLIVGELFEMLDIDAPVPAPVSAGLDAYKEASTEKKRVSLYGTSRLVPNSDIEVAKRVAFAVGAEMLTVMPGFGGTKFGSSVLGAAPQYLTNLAQKTSSAAGIYKGPTKPWAELIATPLGVPWTAEAGKIWRGMERGQDPVSSAFGVYEKKKSKPKAKGSTSPFSSNVLKPAGGKNVLNSNVFK